MIDRYTAAKIIKSFMEVFISDPDNRKAGEIACVLWILIWSAQKGKSGCITIRKVLELSSQDLNSLKPIIEIGGIKLDISLALHQLLRCLCGKGEAIRSCRLFANLDKGGKALERALHDVSTELFGENVTPIQPGAFLESPHLYPGVRMTAAQRRTMKNTRRFVQPLYTHMEIKKMLRKANEDRI